MLYNKKKGEGELVIQENVGAIKKRERESIITSFHHNRPI